MKIRELKLHNFRKFRQAIRLEGLVDGLNLVCEPNETGKSTVLEALRAVLFERHRSKSEQIKSYLPFGDQTAPSVKLAFELDSGRWTVEKRFLQSPHVRLAGPGGQTFESDAAEDHLQGLLGFTKAGNTGATDDTRGALGLLWVEQGMAFRVAPPGEVAKKTIEGVLSAEVGAITGGRRLAAVTAVIDKAFREYRTNGGQPREKLLEATETLDEAQEELTAAEEAFRSLEQAMDALDRERKSLARIERDLNDPELAANEKRLSEDLDRAKLSAATIKVAEGELREAVTTRERLERQRDARERRATELGKALQTSIELQQAFTVAQDALTAAKAREVEAASSVANARSEAAKAESAYDMASKELRDHEASRAFRAGFDRLAQAEVIASQIETLGAAIAANPMTDTALAELDKLEKALVTATANANAGAGLVEARLETSAHGKVRLDDVELTDGDTRPLRGSSTLAVEGVGRFVFVAKGGAQTQAALSKASADIEDYLRRLALDDVASARKSHRERQTAVGDLKAAQTRLSDLCQPNEALGVGAGLQALRGVLSQQTRPSAAEKDLAQLKAGVAETRQAAIQARSDMSAAEAAHAAAINTLGKAETAAATTETRSSNAASTAEQLSAALEAERNALSDADLMSKVSEAQRNESAASQALELLRTASVGHDPEAIQKRIDAAGRRRKGLQDDRTTARETIARLMQTVHDRGTEGPSTRLDAARDSLQLAARRAERLGDEADVLALLKRTLAAASLETSRRYLAPVTSRVEPYVRRLLPGASLTFGEDMSPRLLERGGRSEPTEHLSLGTQEQLAVLTRIAFADLLVEKGKPASLVLDDALVFSDDVRFDTMLEILSEVSQRMQVIILTCRASLFRSLDANKVRLRMNAE
jgi:chromosome segregation ATPase